MRYIIVALSMLLVLTGCESVKNTMRPMPWIFKHVPDNANEDYKMGWTDGCESGLAGMTNTYYQTFYKFKTQPEMVRNPDYYKPWQDAYNYCRHYAYAPIRESDLRQNLPSSKESKWFDTPFEGIGRTMSIDALSDGHGPQQW